MHTIKNILSALADSFKTILHDKRKRKFFLRRVMVIACMALILSSVLHILFRPRSSIPSSANTGNDDMIGEKLNRSSSKGRSTEKPDTKTYLDGKLVVIDPGHGGVDPGVTKGNLMEKDVNLDVALKVGEMLDKANIKTILTRNDDTFMKPSEKVRFANDKKATIFLSIHCNSFKDDSSVNGTTTFYYPSEYKNAGNLPGKEYAGIIQEELMKFIGTRDRGIAPARRTIILKHSDMPSALVELAFMTNDSDAALLSSEDFRQKAAKGIAEGIKKSLEALDSRSESSSDPEKVSEK